MRNRAAIAGCAIVVLTLLWGAGATRADEVGGLSTRLGAVLRSPALRKATVGALVVRDRDGAVLFEHQPERGLIPASNQKLLTALAALEIFGPTHRFETLLYSGAEPDGSGAIGDLIVRGSGDPVLNNEDWWRLALELRSRGISKVSGDLVLDDTAFDRQRWHPNWGRTGARAYHAPVGSISTNYGAFAVSVSAGDKAGAPTRVEISPPVDFLQLSNRAKTSGKGRTRLEVGRKANGTREIVTVGGEMRVGAKPATFYRSVLDPALYAGSVLRWQLAAVGIAFEGDVRRGSVPEGAALLHRFEGRALSEIVQLFMKYSNNQVAETLVKAMGAHATGGVGSWGAGTKAVREALTRLGIELSKVQLIDGSGLSRDNRVSARVLVDALRTGRRSFRFGPEFVAAMPIAALDGTLEKRTAAVEGEVRAKTGLLNSVTALSGYALLPDGERAAFSILVNDFRVADRQAMDAVDRFVAEIVGAL
jgi:D-alanyl-D-alanine carboxypeptidase/D-alanyl-D-alanine-endopeptidase (penicillin-binding protein 4)